MIRACLLLALLLASPAAAESWKVTMRARSHCSPFINNNFRGDGSIDMPAADFGNDGTIWVNQIEVRGASYSRRDGFFAIAGWTHQNNLWILVSVQGRERAGRLRGDFHLLFSETQCFASGKVSD